MFLVGLELDLGVAAQPRRDHHRHLDTPASSCRSRSAEAGVGAVRVAARRPACTFASFVLFIGVSMSITAFPVLARILGDRGLQQTPMGILALTCAAINDAIAWCLLAFVVSVTQATPPAAHYSRSCSRRCTSR